MPDARSSAVMPSRSCKAAVELIRLISCPARSMGFALTDWFVTDKLSCAPFGLITVIPSHEPICKDPLTEQATRPGIGDSKNVFRGATRNVERDAAVPVELLIKAGPAAGLVELEAGMDARRVPAGGAERLVRT